ncbi:hypothetical protein BY458DRAFT_546093 [Sporodiniella umbellata]|nr:hypothetical protein BY458DRAFT_546091 [Sporodiniella umbellata]KAI9276306.1 hypothetical protein BY458DRAFT_546093 [Sporodiniella umbellata]
MVDEQENDDTSCIEEATPFRLKALTLTRQYCEKQEDERIKLFNAAKSGRFAGGINDRTAQKRTKKLKEDKDRNIFEKQTNLVNKPKLQLDDGHKIRFLDFYNDRLQAQIADAIDFPTQKFSGLSNFEIPKNLKTNQN